LQNIPLPPKSRIFVFRAFHSGQIPLISEFERALERTKTQLSSLGYRVETELKLGHAAEMIVEIAETRKPDLIVLGAKGLRSTVSILLGGVAQHVMEYASCPVLVMRAPYHGFHKILLVADGSPSSQSAARYLGKFLLPAEVDVRVMHVLPPTPTPIMLEPYYGAWQTVYAPLPLPGEQKPKKAEFGEALLANLRTASASWYRVHAGATRGDAATEIIDYVQKNKIDLIVAGSRRSQFNACCWAVSLVLVHYSDCSVLIVKRSKEE
jgi:nucleotide-binding universal stress UspA family protein